MNLSKSFLEETRQTWQPYYKKELTEADLIEINTNVFNLFGFLLKIHSKSLPSYKEEELE